jgi:hypothetical protein
MELLGDVGHVECRFGAFGDSVSVGAWFAANVPLAQNSFWTHLMVLLGDEAQVDARFIPFRDSGNLEARYVHDLRRMYHWLRNHFGRTRWNC